MSTRGEAGLRRERRRASKACKRCRDQKIKCVGSNPCEPCQRKGLSCRFNEETEKVVITRRYLKDLQSKLAMYEKQTQQTASPASASLAQIEGAGPCESMELTPESPTPTGLYRVGNDPETLLTNPLACRSANWALGPKNSSMFMGTSSNWAFGRRVLTMTHQTLTGEPLPIEDLLFDGSVYDLGWDGSRGASENQKPDFSILPPRDFASHLISTVGFRCGTFFYLFDRESFMKQFDQFHENHGSLQGLTSLWYVHYLLLLAFGQAFVVQVSKLRSPPGGELFCQAMKLMPELTCIDCCPIEKIQVLCTMALYLQCINCRVGAHRAISQALSVALVSGMHTEMKTQYLDEKFVQKSRLAWWTIYILERHMAALMGVPMLLADEYISAPYPVCPGDPEKTKSLELHVKISQIQSKIHLTVYGIEGGLDSTYLNATRSVLRSISSIADQLNNAFETGANGTMSGISRASVHLHLQYHQCIILTTRPLLFTFLQSRLGHSNLDLMNLLKSESVRGLVQVCLESCQRIIRTLTISLKQGLIEHFLPFDLDSVFTSTICIIIAATIDSSLVADVSTWTEKSYAVYDEISSRGNLAAAMVKAELIQLDDELNQLRAKERLSLATAFSDGNNPTGNIQCSDIPAPVAPFTDDVLNSQFWGDVRMPFGLSPDQLMELANSLDVDSFITPDVSYD